MRNKTPETISEALAHTYTIEQLQGAVRLRQQWAPSPPIDLHGKVDPFDTPFSDERDELDKAEG